MEHSVSQYVGCSRGVPQGSVLGPLLFVLYTSDMSSVLPGSVCHQEFADDVALDYSDYQPDLVCSVLSNAVTQLAEYLDNIGLLLNASKRHGEITCLVTQECQVAWITAHEISESPSSSALVTRLERPLVWK